MTGPPAQPSHDAWMGPATDGGFWSLALRQPDGALIRGVPMSTTTTGARQLARLTAAGLDVGILPELRDMDHFSDAQQIAAEIPGSAFASAVAETAARVRACGKEQKHCGDGRHRGTCRALRPRRNASHIARALLTGAGTLTLRPESRTIPRSLWSSTSVTGAGTPSLWRGLSCKAFRGRSSTSAAGPGQASGGGPARSGWQALGIDTSAEAVRQARGRGARALEQSIFAPVPQPGHWQSVILLDGNIGIGGSVTALLRRCRQLIATSGTLLVEVDADEGIDTAYSAVLEDGTGTEASRSAGRGSARRAWRPGRRPPAGP